MPLGVDGHVHVLELDEGVCLAESGGAVAERLVALDLEVLDVAEAREHATQLVAIHTLVQIADEEGARGVALVVVEVVAHAARAIDKIVARQWRRTPATLAAMVAMMMMMMVVVSVRVVGSIRGPARPGRRVAAAT